MKKKFEKVLVILLLLCFMFIFVTPNVKAVYNVSVSATPNVIGSVASYNIKFIMQKVLPADGVIRITFPTGFTVPQGTLDEENFTVNYNTPYSVSSNGNVLSIVPSHTDSLPAGYVNVQISDEALFKNPSVGNMYYTFIVATSVPEEAINYGNLYIASAVSNVTVTVNPLLACTEAEYIIKFTPKLGLSQYIDYVSIDFPLNTTFPASFLNGVILVDGVPVPSFYISVPTQYRLQIRVPVAISANNVHQIYIPSTFGILNSTTINTPLTIKVSTSKETVLVDSNQFVLTGSSVSNLSMYEDSSTSFSNTSLTFSFVTNNALSSGDFIRIQFPLEFAVPAYTSSYYIRINNIYCASKSVNNNILTIYMPNNLSVSSGQYVTVTIDAGFGIVNPIQPGFYTIKVSTSKDTIPALARVYIIGSSVSNVGVTVDPPVQNANAQYTISFVTSSNGSLARFSDTIYVRFDSHFIISTSIPSGTITVDGVPCSSVTSSYNKMCITVPISIYAKSKVTIVIGKDAGIFNPTSPSSCTVYVSTSKDVIESYKTFDIVASTISQPTVKLSTYGVSENPDIEVRFDTGLGGVLTPADTVSIVFPSGFVLPSSISSSFVKINGYTATSVEKTANKINIRIPINIPASSTVVVTIDKSAGIKNPSTQGDYKISACTSKEITLIASEPFKIVNLPKTTMYITPAQPNGSNGYFKTTPKVSLLATSTADPNPQIYYYIDSGSPQLYTVPISIQDGTHILYFYARDKYGNNEHVQSQEFKVDTVAPVITVTSPADNVVLNQKMVTINGKVSEESALMISGVDVKIKPDLTFEYTATITGKTVFTLIARDVAGNVGQAFLTVLLDITPPSLFIYEPLVFQNVSVPYVDVVGITDEDAVSVYVDNQKVQLSNVYAFSYRVNLEKEGLNLIEVRAVDAVGNETKRTVPVNYISKIKIVLQVDSKQALINDKLTNLDAPPKIVNSSTLVPIRFIATAFGATVKWDPILKIVDVKLGDTEIHLQVGSRTASINNNKVTLSTAPQIISGYTYVPIRFIAEAFNADVQWDEQIKAITIVYPK